MMRTFAGRWSKRKIGCQKEIRNTNEKVLRIEKHCKKKECAMMDEIV